jgi:glycerol-3-phosphate dehydrogenase (NAD(P)+)
VRIVVVGGGTWGTAFAQLLAEREHEVTLGCRDAAQAAAIAETRHNPRYLPALELEGVAASPIADAPYDAADLGEVVAAIPGEAPILVLTKGLDPASGRRLSELVAPRPVAVLSGPNHAEEIAQGLPAATVVASDDPALAASVQEAVHSRRFRVYLNDDMLGVELCGAAKNVMALAAGGVDGLGLGDNAKAGVIARGLAEMARLGEACGAHAETFAGLAGMGDLVVTCWSRHSRNRRAGELIASGRSVAEALEQIGQVVEGITVAPVVHELSQRLDIELPLTEAVCAVLSGNLPGQLVSSLMARRPTTE